jgi:drug/metabolite transporter (DMT)-like permease
VSGGIPSKARLYFLLSLMLLFWSLNFTIGKVALREFPAMLLVGIRTSIAAAFMLPIYFWQHRGKPESWRNTNDFWWLLVLGIFGVVLNQVFYVLGLSLTSVVHAAIIITLTPVLVLLFAAFLKQEDLNVLKIVGMAIAASGVIAIQLSKDEASGATLLGDCFAFLSVLGFAIFTVKSKQFTQRHSGLTAMTIAYVAGAIALAPMTISMCAHFDLARVSAAAWFSLIYMAVFAAVLAYLIYYYALTYLPASRVSAVSYLQPVVATLFAVGFLGERISTVLVIGGILVLTGVVITERA